MLKLFRISLVDAAQKLVFRVLVSPVSDLLIQLGIPWLDIVDSCPNQKFFVLWLSKFIFILYVWRRMVSSFT